MAQNLLPEDNLTKGEREALEKFCALRGTGRDPARFDLAPDTQAELFQLYLNGMNCTEIRVAVPKWGLGQIVSACVTGEWERLRREHIEYVLQKSRIRAAQVIDEGTNFVSKLISASHRIHEENLNKFLASGRIEDLGDTVKEIGSIRKYRETLDILLKLVESKSSVPPAPSAAPTQVNVQINNVQAPAQPNDLVALAAEKKRAAKEARSIKVD